MIFATPLNAASCFWPHCPANRCRPTPPAWPTIPGASLEAVDDLINTLLEISRLDAGAVKPICATFRWRRCWTNWPLNSPLYRARE